MEVSVENVHRSLAERIVSPLWLGLQLPQQDASKLKVVTVLLATSALKAESQLKPGKVAKLRAREGDCVSVALGESGAVDGLDDHQPWCKCGP